MSGHTEPTSAAAPSRRCVWWSVAALVVFAAGASLLLRYEAAQAPRLNGDAWEYWYIAEAFQSHGTPEVSPEDKAAVDAEGKRVGGWNAPGGYYACARTPEGQWFGVHFWAYSLSSLPAKTYLRLTGKSELAALALTNTCWFVLAIGVTLFASSAPIAQRVAMVALAATGAIVWYIPWTGVEIFSWALALIAVVTYRDRRYAWTGLAAGLAATQNPTIIFVGGVAVLAALSDRRWRVAVAAALGTAIGLSPYAFFMYHYGVPNLIVIGEEYAGVRNISWVRTWGLLTDFNQGLLPYLPVLVVAMVVGAIRMVYSRNWRGLLLAASGVAMAVGAEVAHNWNSGCEGLQRYLVWMVPVAAGVAVEGIGGRSRMWVLAVIAALGHTGVEIAYERTDALHEGYLRHTPVAEWVLTHYPRVYWIEPEVFIERGQVKDGWPYFPADFPIGYARPDGTISKMALDPASVEKVSQRYEVDANYMVVLREEAAHESGVFFVHPPNGAVRERSSKSLP
jgi:hypothetical protein